MMGYFDKLTFLQI